MSQVTVVCLILVLTFTSDALFRVLWSVGDLRVVNSEFSESLEAVQHILDKGSIPSDSEYHQIVARVERGQRALHRARRRLGYVPYLGNVLAWVPRWGASLSSSDDALAVADGLSSDAVSALRAVEPVFSAERPQDAMYTVLVVHGDDLTAAVNSIVEDGPRVHRLALLKWHGPFKAVGTAAARVDSRMSSMARAAEFTTLAREAYPALMGYGTEPRYLIAGLNSDEIRPNGGFMGTLGIGTLRQGRLQDTRYSRVASWEPPQPPYPQPELGFRLFYGGVWWRLRDVPWYPDFPRSAQSVIDTVASYPGDHADGVIAINNGFVTRLLTVFQPLTLPEFTEPVTADNWTRLVEVGVIRGEEAQSGASGVDQRQFYIEPIMKALLVGIEGARRDQLPAMASALWTAAKEREFQMFSRDPQVQQLLVRAGVAGQLPEQSVGTDVVAVVDTNLSNSKVGALVTRDISYFGGVDGITELKVTWSNRADQADRGRYPRIDGGGLIWEPKRPVYYRIPNVFGNYVRIYLPMGSVVRSIEGFTGVLDGGPLMEIDSEWTVLSGFIVVEQGQTRTIRVEYEPSVSSDGTRRVSFWRQGGVRGTLKATVNVRRTPGVEQFKLFDGEFVTDLSYEIH